MLHLLPWDLRMFAHLIINWVYFFIENKRISEREIWGLWETPLPHAHRSGRETRKNVCVCFTMTNNIKGADGCSFAWRNSSSHAAIHRDYTPARKARADPQHSKWSTHNWTLLLNDLENSLALHWRQREHETNTEIQHDWKKESIWDTQSVFHSRVPEIPHSMQFIK